VAVIRVGAVTELEMKERKARVEDAVSATRAAVEEGIVPGGGTALLRAARALDSLTDLTPDQKVGVEIVRSCLDEPVRAIATNAGFEGSMIAASVKSQKGAFGFNADTGEMEDLVKAGIVDPTKVTRSALLNASSIGSLILTTEALIAEKPEKEKKDPPQGGGEY